MEEKEKLSIVLEHWIEHNQSHIAEYQKWVERAGVLKLELVKAEINEAIEKLSLANHHLEQARTALTSSSFGKILT
jgi:nickel/cobalt exporter